MTRFIKVSTGGVPRRVKPAVTPTDHHTFPTSNVRTGQGALPAATSTGDYNVANGVDALASNTTGYNNTAIGHGSMYPNTAGWYNTAIGYQTMQGSLDGVYNVAVGADALYSPDTPLWNVAVGYKAMYNAIDGTGYNVAVGEEAGINLEADYCVAAGSLALSGSGTGATVDGTVAIGASAMLALTSGAGNVGVGYETLYAPAGTAANATTTGARQTAVGYQTGQSSTTQRNDTVAVGYQALINANDTVALGSGAQALHANGVALGKGIATTAASQVAVGLTHFELGEIAAPGTPAAGYVRVFANSNSLWTIDEAGVSTDLINAVGSHTVASHSDTTATGAELETLTGAGDASALHNHTTANLNDTTATGTQLNTLTDASNADALHVHSAAGISALDAGDTTTGTFAIGRIPTTLITTLYDDEAEARVVVGSAGDVTLYKDDASTVSMLWDESDDRWEFTTDVLNERGTFLVGNDSLLSRAELLLQASNYVGSGDWLDESGNSHDATNSGSLFKEPEPEQFLYLPGTASNYASVPDAASLDITGDLVCKIRMDSDDYRPAALVDLVSKWGGASASFWWYMDTNGGLNLSIIDGGSTQRTFGVSTAVTPTSGEYSFGFALDADNGTGGSTVEYFESADGVTWSSLGTSTVATTAGSVLASVSNVHVGTRDGTNGPLQAGVFSAQMASSGDINTTTYVLDADFTDRTALSEPFATFLDGTGNHTVTINRSASGVPATVVDRPRWLKATDDYHETADHADLDFAAADDFTLVSVLRAWDATPAADMAIAAKKADLTTAAGYAVYLDTTGVPTFILADGTNSIEATGPALTDNTTAAVVAVRDTAADTITVYTNGVAGTPVTDTTTATLANAEVLRFGRLSGAGTSYLTGTDVAHAVFREALTATEAAEAGTRLARTFTTGMHRKGFNGLGWATGGVEHMTLNETGVLTVGKVVGGTATTADLTLQTTSGVGTTGADMHFLVGNAGATEALTILNSGLVGIGPTAPAAQLHVDQSSATAAIPVLTLDQADVDEDFIKFIGTSDTSVDRALVDAVDFSTIGALKGYIKINIQDDQATNPIVDGDYYIPFYAAPTA